MIQKPKQQKLRLGLNLLSNVVIWRRYSQADTRGKIVQIYLKLRVVVYQ
ncbi:hypothetical protein COO91_01046 [Nostoc flagelliforme CCNUN1]|uniref:Uncharacterized protein n=1 Tax=Nostoc flagelliforme CCNUN1 TaxID=2038116 RepID=A0A2K8SIB3_9NOSO|nr:hypothetical protein COO91_01046 [Nostoc flagelliforme CCNUN1]